MSDLSNKATHWWDHQKWCSMQQKLKEIILQKLTLHEDLERNLMNLNPGTQMKTNATQMLYRAGRYTYKMQQEKKKK